MLIIQKSDIEPMTKVFDKMTLTMSNDVYNGSMETLEIDLDLKSAGGLAIESNELALSLGDASITGTFSIAQS